MEHLESGDLEIEFDQMFLILTSIFNPPANSTMSKLWHIFFVLGGAAQEETSPLSSERLGEGLRRVGRESLSPRDVETRRHCWKPIETMKSGLRHHLTFKFLELP